MTVSVRPAPPLLDTPGGGSAYIEGRHAKPARCGGYSLVGLDGDMAGVYPFRCRRWNCASCGRRKVRQTRRRIVAGMALGPTRFVTLTSGADESPAESLARLSGRWKAFHQRMVRRFGQLEYVAVIELQDRGAPHLHVLVRSPFIPQTWLATNAAQVGFGRIADVRRTSHGIVGYITKALGPGTTAASLPHHYRRVRWSANWSEPMPRRVSRNWPAWYIALAGPARTVRSALARGYQVVEAFMGPPDPGPPRRWVRWVAVGGSPLDATEVA
jgi:hypothetical protein